MNNADNIQVGPNFAAGEDGVSFGNDPTFNTTVTHGLNNQTNNLEKENDTVYGTYLQGY